MTYLVGDIHSYSSYKILTTGGLFTAKAIKGVVWKSHLSKSRGQVLPNQDQRQLLAGCNVPL